MPTSLRNRLAQAEKMIESRNPQQTDQGVQMLAQIGAELARTHPELLGLIIASQLGHSSITATQNKSVTTTTQTTKKVLGITYGVDENTVTTHERFTRTLKFGGNDF